MANWVAITWENDRLLFLSASASGKTVKYEHAAALDEPKLLGELLSKYRLAKADTIVVLNRSDVEVRPMVFPPVPTDELPDLVRFQASREFNHYDPNSPVDFFVTSKLEDVSRSTLFPAVKPSEVASMPEGAPKHILASTLRIATFQKIKTFCEENNLVLRHIALRPCTASFLWRQSGSVIPERASLLVELDKNEASQTILLHGEPLFIRSPKISRPQDVSNPDFAARILAELKRTCIAARNEIQGIDVNEVVLCGSSAAFESLAKQLADGLDMPVRLFNPLQGLTVNTPDADEQHTALFGAIGQAILHKRNQKELFHIDFLNPKKRAEDTSKRNWITGIAVAVICLLVGLFGYMHHAQNSLQKEVNRLTSEFNELERTSGTVVNQRRQLDEIDKWRAGNVNWFEQLGWLSQNALPGQDMMIRNLRFETRSDSGSLGRISFDALLRDQSLVAPMTNGFRDVNHIPQPGTIGPERGNQRYPTRSNMTIVLESH